MLKKNWNPYFAGVLAGIVLVLSVLVAGKYIGASTTFARGASVIEEWVGIDTSSFEYFTTKGGKYGPESLPNWQFLFVIGILIGAFISSISSGDFKLQILPDMWRNAFGANVLTRGVVAFCGGTVGLIGARLAGGCPSGHGLSGLAQLSVSGFIALAGFFVSGMIVANLMYGMQGRS
jgi:hypothetical protein